MGHDTLFFLEMYSNNKNYLMNLLGSTPFSRPFQLYTNADMVGERAISCSKANIAAMAAL
jgi:hypothetical protein